MKMLAAERPLENVPHDELIRLLAANPQNRVLANEFVCRYDEVIRQTVAREIYKRKANGAEMIHPHLEDAVSETYLRLFRHGAQALRRFKGRHANAIFVYLRTIAYRVVSNHYRDCMRHNVRETSQPLDEIEETGDDGEVPRVSDEAATPNHRVERQSMEAMLRANFRHAFRDINVHRNFIIFKLHFIYGYHAGEIAHLKGLGLSERSVGNTTDRMRQWLKQNQGRSRAALGF